MKIWSLSLLLLAWCPSYAAVVFLVWWRERRRSQQALTTAPSAVVQWPELVCLCPMSAGDSPHRLADGVPPYRGTLRFVFLCAHDDVIAQLRAARRIVALQKRNVVAQLVLTTPRGRNPKASQLAQVPKELVGDSPFVLVMDGDVDVASVNATELVRRLLREASLGAIWQPTVPAAAARSWGDRAAAAILTASMYAMPFAGLFKPSLAAGKVFALRLLALDYIGGFAGSAHVLGEDLHISSCLVAMGFRVDALAGKPALSVRVGQSLRAIDQRMGRWHRIIIEQSPRLLWAHVLYVTFWPLQVLLWAGLAASERNGIVIGGLLLATALRTAMAYRISILCARPLSFTQSVVASVFGDAVLFCSLLRAGLSARVRWHGRVVSRGAHAPAASPPPLPPILDSKRAA